MIKTLKRKFIISAMIAVTILLVLLLGAVNVVNAWSTSQDTRNLLDNLVQMEISGRPELPEGETPTFPDGEEPPAPPDGENREREDPPDKREGRGRGFMPEDLTDNDRLSAVYFTVRSRDGVVTKCDVSRISSVSEEEAAEIGASVLSEGKTEGCGDSFRFASGSAPTGESVCVFLENSSRTNAVLRVLALSALAGLGGWLLMLGVVVLLSNRTIAPIAENMERQRRFVTDAGHELKTPLAIIQANTEAMELISGENKWSRNIKAQTARLTELTRNLLTLARAEELPAQGSFTAVDLSALAEKTAQMFQTSMERKELTLNAQLSPKVTVRGSEDQLASLFSILLDNAVKYGVQGSVLRMNLKAADKTCTLRLENNCDKLPDCPPERLFDRFYRADEARSQKGGFGIGLSAAQVIALQHRGRLEAEYPAEDRIAFTVTLPLA